MTTTTYRMIDGELVEVRRTETPAARIHTLGDLEAYESPVTGEMIEGRAAHKEHMKRHNLQEVGNEAHPSTYKRKDNTATDEYRKGLRDDIKRSIQDQKYNRAPTLEQLRGMRGQAFRDMGLD